MYEIDHLLLGMSIPLNAARLPMFLPVCTWNRFPQVQNADDNTYSENVEPTLVFILQPTGIVILNNERGFSAENIKALCDIGNSTKKGMSAGYIGQKGIGFKSVFRVKYPLSTSGALVFFAFR